MLIISTCALPRDPIKRKWIHHQEVEAILQKDLPLLMLGGTLVGWEAKVS